MLNVFPEFLIPFFAPLVLRFVLGGFVVRVGLKNIRKGLKKKALIQGVIGALCVVAGGLVFIGLATQVAALAVAVGAAVLIFKPQYRDKKRGTTFYILLIAMALSLFLSGAGAFALDVPL